MPGDIEYKIAAYRQRQIAQYFLEQLKAVYDPQKFAANKDSDVSIKMQAYFEGCIRAAYSSLDKYCLGKLKAEKGNEVNSLKETLTDFAFTEVASKAELVNQLRLLRNDITHNFTDKNSEGNLAIFVTLKDATKRDIKKFAQSAVQLLNKINNPKASQ